MFLASKFQCSGVQVEEEIQEDADLEQAKEVQDWGVAISVSVVIVYSLEVDEWIFKLVSKRYLLLNMKLFDLLFWVYLNLTETSGGVCLSENGTP